ncbi:MAG: glycosyltransferase [Veillonellaceae bacterium]|nr:glycosyltransferase [Veillonellaceae bacterium]
MLLHPNFPAQFLNLCEVLGRHSDYEIVFLTCKKEHELPGVRKVYFEDSSAPHPETHQYLHSIEKAILQGQSAYKAALSLKQSGFVPDVILGHSGWGSTLYMKDLFPQAALIGYFEWFYHAHGSDLDFDPTDQPNVDNQLKTRTINVPFLMDLSTCDAGICPTQWQKQQFPLEYQKKIWVCHDGVQTERYIPAEGAKIHFPDLGIDLSNVDEVVTYVGRGMEPYRGYPQFMQAMALVLKRRPECHVVIVGAERIAYGGKKPTGYKSYKEWAQKEIDLDWTRVHFTGLLPRIRYRNVLQASSVHVYLTRPFVLSWSMLEAMSCGCLLVASSTPPVKEMVVDGENGLLTDFFDVQAIAARVEEALARQSELKIIRIAARQTIVDNYDWRKLLPQQLNFLKYMAQTVKAKTLHTRNIQ